MKIRKLIGGLVVFLYCLIIFGSINMRYNVDVSDTVASLDYGCYGDSYFGLSFQKDVSLKDFISAMDNNISYAVFADYETENNIKVRSLFFNEKYATFPMEEGRFFMTTDFTDNNMVVVIGKGLKELTFEENNKKYIFMDDVKYEVIGIMGFENKTVIDNICFMNGKIDNNTYNFMQMDLFKNVSADYSEYIISYLDDKNLQADVISGGENYSDHLFPNILKSYLYILLILISFLCAVVMLNHWIVVQKQEMIVRIRVGASFNALKRLLFFRMGLILMIAGALSLISCIIFYNLYIGIFFKTFCFLLIVSFILFIIKIGMYKRWPID